MALREDTYSCLYHIQSDLNNVLIRKYNCEMELKGPRLAAPPSGPEELVYEKKLPGGLRLSVWKGNLTGQVVDAVVNAANEDLMHIGGLALALAKAGGAVIQDESRNHIAKHGKVKAGSIAVTSAGNLPCKVLIHAVGPEWTQGRSAQCELELERVIRSILGYVRGESSIRTVAIPAISSGIFGFPLHRCAEIIAGTTKKFCDTESYHKMAEIRFVNIDTPTVTAMKAACEGSQPAFTIYGLKLYLMKGCIEDQITCVIVNSLGANRNPYEGNISKAILSRAGDGLRQELFYKGQYLTARDIMIPTHGYNLPCNFVYHVILQRNDPKKQILMEAMNACLYTAHKYNAPSISFPALGTGMLCFPKPMVAEVMTEEVLTFATQKPCNMDVFFVIHPSDWETYNVRPQGMAAAAEEMSLTLSGPRHEDTEDAMLWLQNITKAPGSVLIQNKHILLFGKKEHRALGSPQFSRVEISEVLGDGKASLEIKGSQKDVVRAAVQVELMLLDAQEEQAENLQEELFQSAVQWMYDVYKYPARENRRIETAYVSGKNHTLDVGTVSHSIDFKAFRVKAPKQEFKLHRE
ncbi:hypothetical protein XENTR_v10024921, partial [Xenopus tropicalis]